MRRTAARSFAWIGLVLAAWLATPLAAQEAWTVTLTAKQAKDLSKLQAQPRSTAMAVSPDGAWGTAWGFADADVAAARALSNCRGFLKPGRRDCVLYYVDGRVVSPAQVTLSRVSQVYRPVSGKGAAAFYGLAGVSFQGDRATALAQLAQLHKGIDISLAHGADRKLEDALMRRSLTPQSAKGFAIWFEPGRGEQHSQANSGVLKMSFRQWMATDAGLVCMYDSVWMSTGKKAGTRCLVVESISGGQVVFAWGDRPGSRIKGYLVAGDARIGGAR